MNNLTFIEITSKSKRHYNDFNNLMSQYAKELDCHNKRTTTDEFVAKWIDSIIKLKDEPHRYLKLCYDGENLIGFLYAKIDKPEHKGYKKIGYGYIMEFFVLPQYRRKGYGRQMFYHLEKLFNRDGASRMYLTADGVTGKPFWTSMGFAFTGEISPENSLEIFEKEITITNNIQIKILKYPDDKILCDITKRHGDNANEIMMCLADTISSAHYRFDFFCVLAFDDLENIIGFANFFQSSIELQKWFYADLWVDVYYRRQGVATHIVNVGIDYLSQLNAKTLICTVEPNNTASINLHKTIGFKEIPTEPFEDFGVDGLIMYKKNIETNFNIVAVEDNFNHLVFICDLLADRENAEALHIKTISNDEYRQFYKEMREALVLASDKNELNYIIRKGVVPIAWLKLNGLQNTDSLWVSMLVVHRKFRNLGVGKYALEFAQQYALSNNRKNIYIQTTNDNTAALLLYQKLGYKIISEETSLSGDGTKSIKYTLRKEI